MPDNLVHFYSSACGPGFPGFKHKAAGCPMALEEFFMVLVNLLR